VLGPLDLIHISDFRFTLLDCMAAPTTGIGMMGGRAKLAPLVGTTRGTSKNTVTSPIG